MSTPNVYYHTHKINFIHAWYCFHYISFIRIIKFGCIIPWNYGTLESMLMCVNKAPKSISKLLPCSIQAHKKSDADSQCANVNKSVYI